MPRFFFLGRDLYKSLDEHLWAYSRIRIHGGKTQVWNAVDDKREFCDVLEQIAQRSDPHARVWVFVQEHCSSGVVAGTHSCSP